VGEAERLFQSGGAQCSALVQRKRLEVIEGDKGGCRSLVGEAVDWPADCCKVEEGLADGRDGQAPPMRDFDARPVVDSD
jgi:hypothetical protein